MLVVRLLSDNNSLMESKLGAKVVILFKLSDNICVNNLAICC